MPQKKGATKSFGAEKRGQDFFLDFRKILSSLPRVLYNLSLSRVNNLNQVNNLNIISRASITSLIVSCEYFEEGIFGGSFFAF